MIISREKYGCHVTCMGRIGIGYKIVSGRREIEGDEKIGLKMHLIEKDFKLWIVLKWIKLGLNMGITSTW